MEDFERDLFHHNFFVRFQIIFELLILYIILPVIWEITSIYPEGNSCLFIHSYGGHRERYNLFAYNENIGDVRLPTYFFFRTIAYDHTIIYYEINTRP